MIKKTVDMGNGKEKRVNSKYQPFRMGTKKGGGNPEGWGGGGEKKEGMTPSTISTLLFVG